MQKSKLTRKGRKGFTLVEVALAVAVGLIIIGGAVLGYNAVKDNASNSNARNRVLSAQTIIEEFSAANGGRFAASENTIAGRTFGKLWQSKRPDDFNLSPWGGSTGSDATLKTASGVYEIDPVDFGSADSTAAAAAASGLEANAGFITTNTGPNFAADLIYVTSSTTATPWAKVTPTSTMSANVFKNYALGIYDKNGTAAFWDVKGGK